MKKLLTILAFMITAGCSQSAQIPSDWQIFSTNEIAFSLPKELIFTFDLDGGGKTFATNKSAIDGPNDYFVQLHYIPVECSKHITGVSDPIKLQTGFWGKNDFFERMKNDYIPGEEPKCRPPSRGASYVFCAQKDNKRVLICVNQQTDSSTLAEEIFKTFRWSN